MTHLPLVKKLQQQKHMIISTGMASLKEIELTYKTAIKHGAIKLTLLYCVSNYPSKIKEDFNSHSNEISEILKKRFSDVGLSDHSKENIISTISRSNAKILKNI